MNIQKIPRWVLPQAELRRRIAAILAARKTNGWTPTALGVAMGLFDPASDVMGKCTRGKWIGTGEQVRMSRVLHLIETERMKPQQVLCNIGRGVGLTTVAMRVQAPPMEKPKAVFSANVGRRGIKLSIERNRPYTEAELFLEI